MAENGDRVVKLASDTDKKSMMKHIIDSYEIDEIKVLEPSLNDIFVEYAGDHAKEVQS